MAPRLSLRSRVATISPKHSTHPLRVRRLAFEVIVEAFAGLLDRLAFTPSRLAKLRLLGDYFAHTPDPARGYALAALTGGLTLDAAKPAAIRALVTSRVDPLLFEWSYDYVGD